MEGQPIGMEKFASLFLFYFIGCLVSVLILIMEIIVKLNKEPSLWQSKHDEEKVDRILEELDKIANDRMMKLYFINEIRKHM